MMVHLRPFLVFAFLAQARSIRDESRPPPSEPNGCKHMMKNLQLLMNIGKDLDKPNHYKPSDTLDQMGKCVEEVMWHGHQTTEINDQSERANRAYADQVTGLMKWLRKVINSKYEDTFRDVH